MKALIFNALFGRLAKRLDGYKTVIGGVGLIATGIIGLVGRMFPDQGLMVMELDAAFAAISSGLVAIGLAGKAEKVKREVRQRPAAAAGQDLEG